MHSTLYRYFFRRWAMPLLGALLFFTGLMLAFDLRVLARDISTIPGASFRWLLPILATTLPETIYLVLPMATVLGSLMGTQQLSETSEWVASQGLGSGARVILVPWALLSAGLWVVASLNAHLVVPRMAVIQEGLKQRMVDEGLRQALKPGEQPFYPKKSPELAFWMAKSGEIHYLESTEHTVQHLVARRLEWGQTVSDDRSIILSLHDLKGCMLDKKTGTVRQTRSALQQVRMQLGQEQKLLKPLNQRYFATRELLKIRDRDALIELSRRATLPLAAVALMLIGISLGISHPRFHKGGALVKSLGVILAYFLLVKGMESTYSAGKWSSAAPLFLLPLAFLAVGSLLFWFRLRPHHSNRFQSWITRLYGQVDHGPIVRRMRVVWHQGGRRAQQVLRSLKAHLEEMKPTRRAQRGIFARWTTGALLSRWAGTMAVFLSLSLLLEYTSVAGDLSANKLGAGVFLHYWLWNLPPFLSLVLPLGFLFAGVLTFSDASITHEWVAIRAGGVGLAQWLWTARWAWLGILLFTAGLQIFVAPTASVRADQAWNRIKDRPSPSARDTQPWLNLSGTGILWHLEGTTRWGFPLRSPGDSPVLLRHELGQPRSQELAWGGLTFSQGPAAESLFPHASLRRHAKADHAPTRDLFEWLRWAPDAAIASMLWGRLLGWLAGPCLLFAALASAFPAPRQGRGQSLGYSLVVSLAFMGLQMIFSDAARVGEIPATWGVLGPMLMCVGFGMVRLPGLRT